MSTKHTITVLGDITHEDADILICSLKGANIACVPATPESRFEIAILLVTKNALPKSVSQILENNPSAYILPVILEGGTFTKNIGDINSADFSGDPVRALASIISMIQKFA